MLVKWNKPMEISEEMIFLPFVCVKVINTFKLNNLLKNTFANVFQHAKKYNKWKVTEWNISNLTRKTKGFAKDWHG